MTIVLGFNNALAHKMLIKYGQPMSLIQPNSTLNPVTGVVTAGIPTVTPIQGYPFPASDEYVKAYGMNDVQQDDVICFIEAVVEPLPSMQIQINGEYFAVVVAKAITNAGSAYLFICQVRR